MKQENGESARIVDIKFARFKSGQLHHFEKYCLRKFIKHTSLDDLKHQLKAERMRQAGSRSHCDNHASVARVVSQSECEKASEGHFEHHC